MSIAWKGVFSWNIKSRMRRKISSKFPFMLKCCPSWQTLLRLIRANFRGACRMFWLGCWRRLGGGLLFPAHLRDLSEILKIKFFLWRIWAWNFENWDVAENGYESFENCNCSLKNMGWNFENCNLDFEEYGLVPGYCVACLADCHGAAISEDVFNWLADRLLSIF